MAASTFQRFNCYTTDLTNGAHRHNSDTYKVMLTNTAPVATNSVYADVSGGEVANGNGYTTGGASSACTKSNASGVEKLMYADVLFTATGNMGPFRYAILYNATQTSPNKPLVGWLDYGQSVTLTNTEPFTVDYDGAAGALTVG